MPPATAQRLRGSRAWSRSRGTLHGTARPARRVRQRHDVGPALREVALQRREQRVDGEGLGDEGGEGLAHLGVRGEPQQHRDCCGRRLVAQTREQGAAIEVRHHQIGENEVGRGGQGVRERLARIVFGVHDEVRIGEDIDEHAEEGRIVLDHENGGARAGRRRRHRWRPSTSGCSSMDDPFACEWSPAGRAGATRWIGGRWSKTLAVRPPRATTGARGGQAGARTWLSLPRRTRARQGRAGARP